MNLKQETLNDLRRYKLDPKNITFIGSPDTGHSCTWDEFLVLSDIEYDDGYGSQEIASDLCIIFNDNTLLYRHEYDGSEMWKVQYPVNISKKLKPIKRLYHPSKTYATLEELQKLKSVDI